MKSSHIISLSKAPLCKVSLPQVEKVCGSQAAGPMMPSANPTTSHVTTSVSPATSVASDRSPATSPPSVGPAAHQRLQQQSRRWVTYIWWDERDGGTFCSKAKSIYTCFPALVCFCIPPGHSFLKVLEETRVAAWKNCQGKFISISFTMNYYQMSICP